MLGEYCWYPIRSTIEDGIQTDIVVLFLAPERAREVVKKLLITNPLLATSLVSRKVLRMRLQKTG